jgi:head-tail adaptor
LAEWALPLVGEGLVRQAGERPHLVTIQRAVTVTDDYGGESKTWHELATGYARLSYGTGQERREAAQENASQAATFEFDWSPTIAAVKPSDRLYCFDTVWDVASAVTIGANEEVHITAVANLEAEIDS